MTNPMDLFDLTDILQGNDNFEGDDNFLWEREDSRSFASIPPEFAIQGEVHEVAQKIKEQLAQVLVDDTLSFDRQDSYQQEVPSVPKENTPPSKKKTTGQLTDMVLQDFEIFDCLDLDNRPVSNNNRLKASRWLINENSAECCPRTPIKPDPRDQTTIPKVIFTVLKKHLASKCPINIKPYFRICPYGKNHRTLMDFEVPYLYAEHVDQKSPGTLQAFQQFLKSIRSAMQEEAESLYHNNPVRLGTFMIYLNRIFSAYNSGLDSEGRMRILYPTPSKLPGAMAKLRQIQARFP